MSIHIAIGELLLNRPVILCPGRQFESEKEVFSHVCMDVLNKCDSDESQDFRALAREWGMEELSEKNSAAFKAEDRQMDR